jgi:hypothetical protein
MEQPSLREFTPQEISKQELYKFPSTSVATKTTPQSRRQQELLKRKESLRSLRPVSVIPRKPFITTSVVIDQDIPGKMSSGARPVLSYYIPSSFDQGNILAMAYPPFEFQQLSLDNSKVVMKIPTSSPHHNKSAVPITMY